MNDYETLTLAVWFFVQGLMYGSYMRYAIYGCHGRIVVMQITWPIAAIAMAYIAGQTVVDTWAD